MNEAKEYTLDQLTAIRWAAFDLKTISDKGDWEDNFINVLYMYLSKYHSDMRWQVKIFIPAKDDPYRSSKQNFSNTKMHFYDVKGYTVLIYGANAIQKFYGKFNNEEYHEFDHVKEI